MGTAATAISTQRNQSDRLAAVRLYGLLDHDLDEVIEFYVSKDVAERDLADEPVWVEKLDIVLAGFSGADVAITPSV